MNIYYEYLHSNSLNQQIDTILIIHGAGMSLRSWDLIVPYLQQHYHILRYDLRGHGLSDKGPDKLAWRLLFEDTLFLLERLNISSFFSVGHGAGSICAVLLGIFKPNLVLGCSLHSIPLFFPKSTATKFTEHRRSLVQNESIQGLADHIIPNITLYASNSPEIQKLYKGFYKVSLETNFELWEAFVDIHDEIFVQLKGNTKPVVIVSGDLDPIYPTYLSGLQTTYIPNSQCMTILNSSNMTFYDQPEETYKQIHHFFQNGNASPKSEDAFLQALHSELFERLDEQNQVTSENILRVDLLNHFQVFVNGEQIVEGWNQRYAKQILNYLVMNPSVTREQLCDDLWGEVTAGKARHNLRMYLTHLRKLIKNDEYHFLRLDKEYIYLSGNIECDLTTLLKVLNEAWIERDSIHKQHLCSQIFEQLNKNSFRILSDNWILRESDKWEEKFFTLSQFMSEVCLESEELSKAIEYMKWAVHFQPDNEEMLKQIGDLYLRYSRLEHL
ncbi:alpha/beta hydrolase [Paenibacillus odorifer]|nr:alpha/beta hydrolase [Paenibacillus odorifer]